MRLYWALAVICGMLFYVGIAKGDKVELQLADIVGGGDGTGTGVNGAGINPLDGSTTPLGVFTYTQTNDSSVYHPVVHPFIDGVFIPDGGAGPNILDSAGHTFGAFPNTDSNSWDVIRYGTNQNSGNQLNFINYNAAPNNMIGLHANKGITFDLDAMELAHAGLTATHFSAVAGMTRFGGGMSGGFGTADFWVFLDGVLQTSQVNATGGVGYLIDLNLNPNSRFLTLVSTDHGDDFLVDQVIFGNAVVTLQAVPEPSAVILLLIGGLCLIGKWQLSNGRLKTAAHS